LNLPTLGKDDIEYYDKLFTHIREEHYMNRYGSTLNDEQKAPAAKSFGDSAETG